MGVATIRLHSATPNTRRIVFDNNSNVLAFTSTAHNSVPLVIALPIRYAEGRLKEIARMMDGTSMNAGGPLDCSQLGTRRIAGPDLELLSNEIVICCLLMNYLERYMEGIN